MVRHATYEDIDTFTFGRSGDLTVTQGKSEMPLPYGCRVVGVIARVSTAPTGADLEFDVKIDGSTVFDSDLPVIPAGEKSATKTGAQLFDTVRTVGQVLRVDITQVGSTVAGADLVVLVLVNRVKSGA